LAAIPARVDDGKASYRTPRVKRVVGVVVSHSRLERNSAKRPQLTSTASSPESFRSSGTRAVGAISLNVLENPRNPGLLGGASGIRTEGRLCSRSVSHLNMLNRRCQEDWKRFGLLARCPPTTESSQMALAWRLGSLRRRFIEDWQLPPGFLHRRPYPDVDPYRARIYGT
jgi:hypothetical protein